MKNTKFIAQMPVDLIDAVKEIAKEQDISAAQVIRTFVLEGVQKHTTAEDFKKLVDEIVLIKVGQ